jgi:hypothetical protein
MLVLFSKHILVFNMGYNRRIIFWTYVIISLNTEKDDYHGFEKIKTQGSPEAAQ